MRVCWRRYEQSPSSANSVAQVEKNQRKREALLFERLTPRAPRVADFYVLFCFARRTSPKGGPVRGLLLAGNFLRFLTNHHGTERGLKCLLNDTTLLKKESSALAMKRSFVSPLPTQERYP